MIDATISIQDRLSDDLRGLISTGTDTRPLMADAARRVSRTYADHFRARNARPNKNNWPKRNFWARLARATSVESVTADKAVVVVADPALPFRLLGGVLTPKRGRYLAIPARAEAYKAGSPRESGMNLNFELVEISPGRYAPALVQAYAQRIAIRKRKSGSFSVKAGEEEGGAVMYWLRRRVKQGADPDAVPKAATVSRAIDQSIDAWAKRVSPGNQGGG